MSLHFLSRSLSSYLAGLNSAQSSRTQASELKLDSLNVGIELQGNVWILEREGNKGTDERVVTATVAADLEWPVE